MIVLQDDDQSLRDYVVPLVAVMPDPQAPSAFRIDRFLGTAFLIGDRGWALTAAHVLKDEVAADAAAALFVVDGKWRGVRVVAREVHPTADVAAILLEANHWRASFLCMNRENERQGCSYWSWGYPEDVLWEQVVDGKARVSPDLVYFEGYVRRALSEAQLPVRWGARLWELSDPGGRGCSGAPIVKRQAGEQWSVIGMYVGERTNSDGIHVGYAVQRDDFADWSPSALGHSVIDEAAFSA